MLKFKFFKETPLEKSINIIDENNIETDISIKDAEIKFGVKWLEHDISLVKLYQKFQIRYMGEILGWGLFAKCDIEEGETIGILTGEIYFQDRDKEVISKHILLSDAPNNQYQVVDATNYGNLTRFIQHLPTEVMLEKITFTNESARNEVATCNVKHSIVELDSGIVTEHYSALKRIKAGEILGSNYDPQCWLEKQPLLVRKDGSVLDKASYCYPLLNPVINSGPHYKTW